MAMSIDDLEYQLCELRDKCIRFKENGNCKNTNCQKCAYQSVCNMWRMLDGNDDRRDIIQQKIDEHKKHEINQLFNAKKQEENQCQH